MSKIMNFPKAFVPEQGDRVCQEADGCPTERAVLQRFWRAHQPENQITDSAIVKIWESVLPVEGMSQDDDRDIIAFARALLAARGGRVGD